VFCEATIYRLLHAFSTPEIIDFFLLEDPQIVGELQKLVPKLEIFSGLRPEPRTAALRSPWPNPIGY